jgi:hypothetical protein
MTATRYRPVTIDGLNVFHRVTRATRRMRRVRERRSAIFAREALAEGGRPEREVVALGEGLRL